jgi:hypothetical protein
MERRSSVIESGQGARGGVGAAQRYRPPAPGVNEAHGRSRPVAADWREIGPRTRGRPPMSPLLAKCRASVRLPDFPRRNAAFSDKPTHSLSHFPTRSAPDFRGHGHGATRVRNRECTTKEHTANERIAAFHLSRQRPKTPRARRRLAQAWARRLSAHQCGVSKNPNGPRQAPSTAGRSAPGVYFVYSAWPGAHKEPERWPRGARSAPSQEPQDRRSAMRLAQGCGRKTRAPARMEGGTPWVRRLTTNSTITAADTWEEPRDTATAEPGRPWPRAQQRASPPAAACPWLRHLTPAGLGARNRSMP